MRGLLVALLLALIVVGAVGYHQGWFTVAKTDGEKGVNFNVSVDKEKINADKEQAKEKFQGISNQVKSKAKDASGKGKENATSDSDADRK
jgi:hypothetical protein